VLTVAPDFATLAFHAGVLNLVDWALERCRHGDVVMPWPLDLGTSQLFLLLGPVYLDEIHGFCEVVSYRGTLTKSGEDHAC
jgi:hypothetical protein